MIEYFQYPFFVRAFVCLILLSLCSSLIGTYIISRRLVSICGGVTHACFGGLGLGYFLGINPVLMAGVFALGSSAAVEWMSERFKLREDSTVAVIWALGMAVGVLFVFITPGYVPELNTFLFGNILTVNNHDLLALAIFTAVAIVYCIWQRRHIVAVAFDRDFAVVAGLPVKVVTYTMTILVAVCIVLTIKLVGIMMLMSVLSLPIITAETWCRRVVTIVPISALCAVACSLGGLLLGTAIDVPCSALVVLLMCTLFVVSKLCRSISLKAAHTRTA